MIHFNSQQMGRIVSTLTREGIDCLETLTQVERKALKVAIENLVDKQQEDDIEGDIIDEVRDRIRSVEVMESNAPPTSDYLSSDQLATFIKEKAAEFKIKQEKQAIQQAPQGMLTQQVWKAKSIWGEMRPDLVRAAEQFRLSSELIKQAQSQYIDNSQALQEAPKATQGLKAKLIIIPNDLPIVIRINAHEHGNRLEKAEQIYTICKMNNFTHLASPKMQMHGNFIIEDKIGAGKKAMESLHFYANNSEKFHEAVGEFTTFLCLAELKDLAGTSGWDYLMPTHYDPALKSRKGEAHWPRYDNVLVYEEGGRGKLGLIDFDHFDLRGGKPSQKDISEAVSTAIRLFPYHADIVLKKGYEFLKAYSLSDNSYEEFSNQFKTIIEDQQKFVNFMQSRLQKYEAMGISSDNISSLPIKPETIEKIQQRIQVELPSSTSVHGQEYPYLKAYVAGYGKNYSDKKKWNFENYSQEKWNTIRNHLVKDIPGIIEEFKQEQENRIKSNLKNNSPTSMSNEQISTFRTLESDNGVSYDLEESLRRFYQKGQKVSPQDKDMDSDLRAIRAYSKVKDIILEELVESGVLHGFGAHLLFW